MSGDDTERRGMLLGGDTSDCAGGLMLLLPARPIQDRGTSSKQERGQKYRNTNTLSPHRNCSPPLLY